MRFTKLLICFVALSFSLMADAKENGKGRGHLKDKQSKFLGIDRNRDGVVTRSEWRGNSVSFRNHDANGDGILSGGELRGRGSPVRVSGNFDRIDFNDNGVITLGEWNGSRTTFNWLDRDDDGVVTAYEYANPPRTRENVFSALDLNGDGVITRREWEWSNSNFSQFDDDGDGRVSNREFFTREWQSIMSRMLNSIVP